MFHNTVVQSYDNINKIQLFFMDILFFSWLLGMLIEGMNVGKFRETFLNSWLLGVEMPQVANEIGHVDRGRVRSNQSKCAIKNVN